MNKDDLENHVNEMVNKLFGPNFVVVKEKNQSNVSYEISHNGNICLQFEFMNDFSSLFIYKLATCGDGRNGKTLMGVMDRLAASIPNFKHIFLQDASGLVFCGNKIGLAHLKILTSDTAESWYGSLGYKSTTDETDKIHNQRIANMTVDEAFTHIKKLNSDTYKYTQLKQQEIKLFGRLETDKMSVKDYVNLIVESIHEFKDKPQCSPAETEKTTFVASIITELGALLKYGTRPDPLLKKQNVSVSSGIPGSVSSGTISRKPYAIMIPGGIGTGFGGRGTKRKRRASKKRGKSKNN
jgi:hypothetical protein